jgi:hypothetical protein
MAAAEHMLKRMQTAGKGGRREPSKSKDEAASTSTPATSGRFEDAESIKKRWPGKSPAELNVLARDEYVLRELIGEDYVPLYHPRTNIRLHNIHPENAKQNEATVLFYMGEVERQGGVLEGFRVEMNAVTTDDKDSSTRAPPARLTSSTPASPSSSSSSPS